MRIRQAPGWGNSLRGSLAAVTAHRAPLGVTGVPTIVLSPILTGSTADPGYFPGSLNCKDQRLLSESCLIMANRYLRGSRQTLTRSAARPPNCPGPPFRPDA